MNIEIAKTCITPDGFFRKENEHFYSKLQTTLGVEHPELGQLLLQLQKEDVAAEQALRAAVKVSHSYFYVQIQ